MAVKPKTTEDSVNEIEAYYERKDQRLAPAWMPEAGSTIKAEVIGRKMSAPGGEFGQYPIIIYKVQASAGTASTPVGSVVAVHAFHTLLRDKLKELGTDIGKVQWITYEGKRESRNRKDSKGEAVQYHLYDVENDGVATDLTGTDEDFAF